jgi:hypothetical protein
MAQAGGQKKGRFRRFRFAPETDSAPRKGFLKPIAKLAAHELILTVNEKGGH